ncbi:MAG TPA: PilZ domain-containing protein, partial [Myxococcaceae bacterium]|nr:PilZ domain-containing protein [Myxococcaceae bacterium]
MDEPRPQRQHARIRSSKILVRIPTVDKLRAHYLRDLSEGGIFVKSERTLPIGTAVNIELVPPGWTASLILTGRVVRIATDEEARKTNAVGMAIRFEEVTPEAQQALTELIRKHSQSEALSAPLSGDEAERLRTQVQGLMFELSAARESLQACERDRDAQAARVPAGGSPSGPADDGGELVFLRAHLETANARVAKLQEELRRSEDDEAQSRALAERLAHEKRLLEKSQKEASRDTGEVERLRQELQDSEARFASERDRAEALKRRAYTADSELRAAQAQAKAERERSAQLERELEPLRGDLDRSRAKERDLRRLLSLVSSDAAEGSARPVELPSASAVPPREPEPSE